MKNHQFFFKTLILEIKQMYPDIKKNPFLVMVLPVSLRSIISLQT